MFNHIIQIISNGALWSVIAIILGALPKINRVIEAHLTTKKATRRNAQELSLMRAADRIIPSIAKVAEASKADRLNEAVDEIVTYANSHKIPIKQGQAENLVDKAVSDFKNNGGNFAQTVKDVSVND